MDLAAKCPQETVLVSAWQGRPKGFAQKQVIAVKFLTALAVDCLLDIAAGRGYQKTKKERKQNGPYLKLAGRSLEDL